VVDADLAAHGEEGAAAAVAGGDHAVEHVDAAFDGGEDVLGEADAHQVAGVVLGQVGRGGGDDLLQEVEAFADAHAADGVAVEVEARDLLRAALAEVGEGRALDDAEEELLLPLVGGEAALLPAKRPLDRFGGAWLAAGVFEALVEDHRDVAAELLLDLDR